MNPNSPGFPGAHSEEEAPLRDRKFVPNKRLYLTGVTAPIVGSKSRRTVGAGHPDGHPKPQEAWVMWSGLEPHCAVSPWPGSSFFMCKGMRPARRIRHCGEGTQEGICPLLQRRLRPPPTEGEVRVISGASICCPAGIPSPHPGSVTSRSSFPSLSKRKCGSLPGPCVTM